MSRPDGMGQDVISLSSMNVGDIGLVVAHGLESMPPDLAMVEAAGLIPGTRVHVVWVSPTGAFTVKAARQVVSLSAIACSVIWVRPGDLDSIARSDHSMRPADLGDDVAPSKGQCPLGFPRDE